VLIITDGILTSPFLQPEASFFPSGDHATYSTQLLCPMQHITSQYHALCPVDVYIMAVRSLQAAAQPTLDSRGHRRTLYYLPVITSLIITCIGLWNKTLVGGRALLDWS